MKMSTSSFHGHRPSSIDCPCFYSLLILILTQSFSSRWCSRDSWVHYPVRSLPSICDMSMSHKLLVLMENNKEKTLFNSSVTTIDSGKYKWFRLDFVLGRKTTNHTMTSNYQLGKMKTRVPLNIQGFLWIINHSLCFGIFSAQMFMSIFKVF